MSTAHQPVGSGDGFVVDIDRFQGPLELLLHLIREQDIDIFDIPISRITNQFLEVVREIEAHDLDSAGSFLELAATLVRIKAQMILPRPMEEDDEDPRAELVRRLLEYEQIREITHRLGRAEAERARRRSKGYLEDRPRPSFEDVPLETEWEEVLAAALEVSLPEPFDSDHRVTPRTISMEEKSHLILSSLGLGPGSGSGAGSATGVEFRRLLEPFREKMHGVMTFLAGLELSRRRRVLLRQSGPFKELWIYPRDEEDAEDAAKGEDAVDSSGASPVGSATDTPTHPGAGAPGGDADR